MLLSIDQSKIDEQLENYRPLYVASPCNLEVSSNTSHSIEVSTHISGTENYVSPDVARYRERVLAARKTIIDRGERSASSPEELEQIIDEFRGRV